MKYRFCKNCGGMKFRMGCGVSKKAKAEEVEAEEVEAEAKAYTEYHPRLGKTTRVLGDIPEPGKVSFTGMLYNQMDGPAGVAVDGEGNIYVANQGGDNVLVFSGEDGSLKRIVNDVQMQCPRGVAVDREGKLYVTDNDNRVLVFSGDELAFERAVGLGHIEYASGVAVDGDSNIYVADERINDRVVVLREDGAVSVVDGQMNSISSVAVDREGNVYVADTSNHRVQVFSGDNYETVRVVGRGEGGGNGQMKRPHGVAVDGEGNIYVADTYNRRIQVFKWKNDNIIFDNLIELNGIPIGVAVDWKGAVIVSDIKNNRVQVLHYMPR